MVSNVKINPNVFKDYILKDVRRFLNEEVESIKVFHSNYSKIENNLFKRIDDILNKSKVNILRLKSLKENFVNERSCSVFSGDRAFMNSVQVEIERHLVAAIMVSSIDRFFNVKRDGFDLLSSTDYKKLKLKDYKQGYFKNNEPLDTNFLGSELFLNFITLREYTDNDLGIISNVYNNALNYIIQNMFINLNIKYSNVFKVLYSSFINTRDVSGVKLVFKVYVECSL